MKKEWLNPELMNLNVVDTKEELECETENEEAKIAHVWNCKHICPLCRASFGHGRGSHGKWESHMAQCKGGSTVVTPETPEVQLS